MTRGAPLPTSGADGAAVIAEAADLVRIVRRRLQRASMGEGITRMQATRDVNRLAHVAGLLDRMAIAARGAAL